MRKLIFVPAIVLLASFTGCSQLTEAPDGAAGVKFGMNPTEVKDAWDPKADLFKDVITKKPDICNLLCSNLTISSETFDVATADFVNNKLCKISLLMFPGEDGTNEENYDRLRSTLKGKYKRIKKQRLTSEINVNKVLRQTTWDYSPISVIELKLEAFTDSVGAVTLEYRSVNLFREYERANAEGF